MKSELIEIYEGLHELEALLCCVQSKAEAHEDTTLSVALLHILLEMRGLNLRLKAEADYQERS